MSFSIMKSRAGKFALALGLGAALAWAVLVGGPTGHQISSGVSHPNSVVVADGGNTNPPPGPG